MTASSRHSTNLQRRAFLVGVSMLAAVGAAEAMRPRHHLAATLPPLKLDAQVPRAFGDWRVDDSLVPLEPDPTLQEKLDELYSQTVSRTYRNAAGQRVMLSIAYGADQASEVTSVHRPEFCYRAQGFEVSGAGRHQLALDGRALTVQRLVARQGERLEPISYWITLGDRVMLPGWSRRLEQMRYGLHGDIPDGMLVRVSTIGLPPDESFAVQDRFIAQLRDGLSPDLRPRLFGA